MTDPPTPPTPPFVLDLESNPHPDLLALALQARQRRDHNLSNLAASSYYLGIIHACTAATGCTIDEITQWIDHHA